MWSQPYWNTHFPSKNPDLQLILFTKANITVFIYHHMQSSIYHATYDPIKLERSRPILWCAPALSAGLNDLMAMFMSENNSSEDKTKKPAS